MAYDSWSSNKWTEVWNNGYYKIEVEWSYRQDAVANVTEVRVTRERVTSLKSGYSFSKTTSKAGISTITAERTTSTVSSNVASLSSQIYNLADHSREKEHLSDGTLEDSVYIHGYFDAGFSGENHTPAGGWQMKNIAGSIASIDRAKGKISASLKSVGINTVNVVITCNVITMAIEYSLDGGKTWKETGVNIKSGGDSVSYSVTGLKEATTYSIQFRHKRSHNAVYSSPYTLSATTLSDQAKVYIKDSSWKKGKVYYKKNGSWKKVKKIYCKEGSSWKKSS